MKTLKTFEAFNNDMLLENFIKNAYNNIKSKVVNWANKNFAQTFNKGVEFAVSNNDNPEIQKIVNELKNLPEEGKTKLKQISENPDAIYQSIESEAGSLQESVDSLNEGLSESIKAKLLKIFGGGTIFAGVINLAYSFVTINQGPGNYFSNGGGLPVAVSAIILGVGVIVGAYLIISGAEKSDNINNEA